MRTVFIFLLLLSFPPTGLANVPAAYFACEGADNGDSCQLPGPVYGNCVLDTLCDDPEATPVNECLLCVDGCWGLEPDSFCIQQDGSDGVCQAQDQCTTDPDKSFDQCNWCTSGDIPRQAAADGCRQSESDSVWLWALIIFGLIREQNRG